MSVNFIFYPRCTHTHTHTWRSAFEVLLTNTELVAVECYCCPKEWLHCTCCSALKSLRDVCTGCAAKCLTVAVAQTSVSTPFWCENRVPSEIWSRLKHVHACLVYAEIVQEGNFNGICKPSIYKPLIFFKTFLCFQQYCVCTFLLS